MTTWPVVVVGAGQAGLATAYHLRRLGLVLGQDVLVVDAGTRPGGAWRHMWPDLRLFSPAAFSSLPGWPMPPWDDRARGYPPRAHVVDYLTRYEERYAVRVRRPTRVTAVRREADGRALRLDLAEPQATTKVSASLVVGATGTWSRPFWPAYPGARDFRGRQLHAAQYRGAAELAGLRVAVVGGGNSAAQILAEVSAVTGTLWVTQREPRFLADDVDGRDLFAAATARVTAAREGRTHEGVGGLGDIVMVPSVLAARDRGVLVARPAFEALTPTGLRWADGAEEPVDAVIWCTGFRPALRPFTGLHLRDPDGRVRVDSAGRALREPRLHLVGYGDWTGPASATLIGVGRSARAVAAAVVDALGDRKTPRRRI